MRVNMTKYVCAIIIEVNQIARLARKETLCLKGKFCAMKDCTDDLYFSCITCYGHQM